MKKLTYTTPEVEVIELSVEMGFSTSIEKPTEPDEDLAL